MKAVQKKLSDRSHFDPLPDMDDKQFGQWVKLLEDRTGMVLPEERKSFLVTNLGLRMREIDCSSYQEYFELLSSGVNGLQEWNTLVDRITVHETRFFRHPTSLEVVKDYVKTKPVDQRTGKVSVQVWSVACSTGEEAWTLAMVIDQVLKLRQEPSYFGITATDISPASLQTGRKAVYPERRVENIDTHLRNQYFVSAGKGKYQVGNYLRKRICFARMNVLDIAKEPVGKMDVIYCQNLLIYFDRETRLDIVNNMARHILPGGLLILGSGEMLNVDNPLLEKINNPHVLTYRRKSENDQERIKGQE